MLDATASALRHEVQQFVRRFGLFADDRTPCGQPLTPREAHALMLILGRERQHLPLVQKDLVAELGIDKSNVTRLVQSLARAGRVQCTSSDRDGRARLVQLTAKGRRLAESVETASQQRFQRLLGAIAPGQRAAVVSAFAHLNQAIARSAAEALHAME
jgi:MarR family transcriptional regulator for hemolysin